jgi:hypothetical protein
MCIGLSRIIGTRRGAYPTVRRLSVPNPHDSMRLKFSSQADCLVSNERFTLIRSPTYCETACPGYRILNCQLQDSGYPSQGWCYAGIACAVRRRLFYVGVALPSVSYPSVAGIRLRRVRLGLMPVPWALRWVPSAPLVFPRSAQGCLHWHIHNSLAI